MPADHIRYDILVQNALRGMVREVLAETVKMGLPGEHHFFITFDTVASGARVSERLLAQYPEEMTIILQHQFWDLKVTDEAFEVGLSFGGVPERLVIPFVAIKAFADPSVQFTLQFESLTDGSDDLDTDTESDASESAAPARGQPRTQRRGEQPAPIQAAGRGNRRTSVPTTSPAPTSAPEAEPAKPDGGSGDKPGAEVVRLDRFRKK